MVKVAETHGKGDVSDMAEEASPPQMDPCQHLRDRIQQLGQEILELQDLLDSGEAPPPEVERIRAEIGRREAERSRTERELDECEQEATKEPAMLTFGQPTFQSDEKFDLAISDDKRALTLGFLEGFEVTVGGSKSPAPTATRAFFLVLPLEGIEGGHERVEIEFFCSNAFVVTTEGATATLVFSVNGQTTVADFPENSEQSFVHPLKFTAPSSSECRICVFLLVGRDSNSDAEAFLSASVLDAEILPRPG